MKLIYSHESIFMATNIKNLIELQGIDIVIKNEFTQGAIGEIAVTAGWPEVWVVNDDDYEPAMVILEAIKLNEGKESWICEQCSEENEPAFELCWKCQHDPS